MNGVFDLGGTDGLGPIIVDNDEALFGEEWERAGFAMFSMCFRAGFFGLDEFRHAVEKMDPAAYLKAPYYAHWLHAVEHFATTVGGLDTAELERRTQMYLENPAEPLPEHDDGGAVLAFVNEVVPTGASAKRETKNEARFAVGEWVRVNRDSPAGHTRRAGYVRGCVGEIVMAHGGYIYPDAAGNGMGEAPEHVYTVRFDSTELWGKETGDANGAVYFDVWDPYIELNEKKESAA